MELEVTENQRGTCLKLNFAIISKAGYSNEKNSAIFNIDDLVQVRLKFITDSSFVSALISFKKHEQAVGSTIKIDVNSKTPEYKKQWSCTEHWIDWQEMGLQECVKRVSDYLTVFTMKIMVVEEKSFKAEKIYEDSDLTDFVLSTADGNVPVHRIILAAHSEMFKSMLSREWKETAEGRMQIEGVTLKTLQHLKQYMYLRILPDEGLRPLLQVAMCYLVDDLMSACISKLARTVTAEELEDLLSFASQNKISELTYAILQLTPDEVVHKFHQMKKKKQICEKVEE